MSIFSGKCDLYDSVVMIHQYTEDELRNNVKIYVGDNPEPLVINSYKDLIPYYPYVIGSSSSNNNGVERTATIHLTSKSWVDIEEERTLTFYLEQVLKIYNRCKRKKIEFDVDAAVKELPWAKSKDFIRILAERVKEKGKKATIEGIHLPLKNYYRKELAKEMINNGLNPADWGYGEFVTR